MKKRPNLILREPVKLYENKREEVIAKVEKNIEEKAVIEIPIVETIKPETPIKEEVRGLKTRESVKEKLPPRIGQIWDYICRKAKTDAGINPIFSLTRAEVMKEAGIGSTNTYRDALKRFQDLGLLEIKLRPGVNSGSIFTLTEKGIGEME